MKNCNGAGKQDTLHPIQCDFYIYNTDSCASFRCSIEDAGGVKHHPCPWGRSQCGGLGKTHSKLDQEQCSERHLMRHLFLIVILKLEWDYSWSIFMCSKKGKHFLVLYGDDATGKGWSSLSSLLFCKTLNLDCWGGTTMTAQSFSPGLKMKARLCTWVLYSLAK